MTNDEVKEYARQNPDMLMEKARKKGYICPVAGCNSGAHGKGTGIILNPKSQSSKHQYICFVCGWKGDVLDYIGERYGLTGYIDKINKTRELLNLGDYTPTTTSVIPRKPVEKTKEEIQIEEEARKKQAWANNREIAEAHKRLGKFSYHRIRGISDETAERFYLGYKSYGTDTALIIPTGTDKTSYIARFTLGSTRQNKVQKPVNTPSRMFNETAMFTTTDKPVFIVEGEIDALSIEELGGAAVGLGGTSNKSKLLDVLQAKKPSTLLIISMDNDEAGKHASDDIVEGLKKLNIEHIVLNISGYCKDANELLMLNRRILKRKIDAFKGVKTLSEAVAKIEEVKKLASETIPSAFYDLEKFKNVVENNINTKAIPTGYDSLDQLLEGGLYTGLYVIGALSGLGKTTYCLQMADQIAKSGNDVIIFSFEMSKWELMAKSISREAFLVDCRCSRQGDRAKLVTRDILRGNKYIDNEHRAFNTKEETTLHEAMDRYAKFADNVYIYENENGVMNTNFIRKKVEAHIAKKGKKPVVFVDYLQIIPPVESKATTDKQAVDAAVMALKVLSREAQIPVVAISSFNRNNYESEVNLGAFKESGNIEYTADVVLGLQITGTGTTCKDSNNKDVAFNVQQALGKNVRKVDLWILKNRNGATYTGTGYDFHAEYNYFEYRKSDGATT